MANNIMIKIYINAHHASRYVVLLCTRTSIGISIGILLYMCLLLSYYKRCHNIVLLLDNVFYVYTKDRGVYMTI